MVIYPEDTYVEKAIDQEGFHLFIKKKPAISSILLTEAPKPESEDTYSYRAMEWNEVNGNEMYMNPSSPIPRQDRSWFLMDSSPENHPLLGEAFHVYIPPLISYGYPETRHATLVVEDGLLINIRTFALPYVDYGGSFRDNTFLLSITLAKDILEDGNPLPDDVVSAKGLLIKPLGPDLFWLSSETEPIKPIIRLVPLNPPSRSVKDVPPDPPKSLSQESPSRKGPGIPADTGFAEETRMGPPGPAPKEEGPIFAPTIYARGGEAILFPGPEGIKIGLQNDYDPVGTLILTNKLTSAWGFHVAFERDPTLMNRIIARATWDIPFIGLEAGPYFGLLNSRTGHLSSGLSLVLHVRIPRWSFFSSFQRDTPLGKEPSEPGDYIQSYGEVKAGFILPFGRLILSMTDRNSTLQDDLGLDITNHWIRYNLALELGHPRVAFGFRIDGGYQRLHWSYRVSPLALEYEYYNVYVGLEPSYRIGPVTLFLGVEAPVYPFVYPHIQSLEYPQVPFFGQITLGFKWTSPLR
ncbi:MAG: hypothetical protein LBU25_10545 [Treponema sp.]|jgi:hypothetical protein|nr:hypothetical protein [Treponema sp.]